MSNYNDGAQPPSGEPPKRADTTWQMNESDLPGQKGAAGQNGQPGPTWPAGQPGPSWPASQPGSSWQAGRPGPAWQNGQPGQQGAPGQPGVPWQTGQPGSPNPPDQPGSPWQNQPPRQLDQPAPPWQAQQANPWQTPPGPRKPYVPDMPPGSGANDWAYEHPQAPMDEDNTPFTVKDYFINILLFTIPCVGWIIALVFAFGSSGTQTRRNLARGYLLNTVVWIGFGLLIEILAIAAGASLFNIFRGY